MTCDGGPETIAVDVFAQAERLLARLERRLDAAERAVIRAAERGVNRRVWFAIDPAETMPIVRSVPRHRQQIPGDAGDLVLYVLDQRSRRIRRDSRSLAVDEPAHPPQVRAFVLAQRGQQIADAVQPFVAGHVVAGLLAKGPLRKSGDMAAKHQHAGVRADALDRRHDRGGACHVLGRGGRLMTVDDDGHEAWMQIDDSCRRFFRAEVVRFSVDELHREAAAPDEGRNQSRPHRVFDRGEPLAERLIQSHPAPGIHEHEVETACAHIVTSSAGSVSRGIVTPIVDATTYCGRLRTSL